MRKRLLTLVLLVVGIAVLIAGVALAEEGLAPSDPVTTSETVLPPDTIVDPTTSTDSTTVPEVTDVDEPDETTDPTEVTEEETEDPANWGSMISDLRHSEEEYSHAPAALLMGKEVKGWTKNHPDVTVPTFEKPKPNKH